MPEFAEAEIHRRNLNHWTRGRFLSGLIVYDPERIDGDASVLVGRRILRWGRRAKYLFCALEGGLYVLVHLGMSGNFYHVSEEEPRFTRFVFQSGADPGKVDSAIALVDRRRFGRLWILDEAEFQRHQRLMSLGPEPMGPGFNAGYLRAKLGRSKAAIHGRMLEQDIGAGVGNIAVVEACYLAGIHPRTPCNQMDDEKWWNLIYALRDHFEKLLQHPIGEEMVYLSEGRPEPLFLCYAREGEPCAQCGTKIGRAVYAGRPAFFCSECQPAPES